MPPLSNCIGASVSLPLKTIEHKSLPIQPQKEKVKVVPRANGVENAVKYSPGRKVKCTPTPLFPIYSLKFCQFRMEDYDFALQEVLSHQYAYEAKIITDKDSKIHISRDLRCNLSWNAKNFNKVENFLSKKKKEKT